jgi:hypothetical protein
VKIRIENELAPLIGLDLSLVGRGAAMLMFTFGPLRTIPDTYRDRMRQVGDFSLHLQCPWRLCAGSRILIGSSDVYYPADLPYTEPIPKGFDWDVAGENRCDRFFESFVRSHSSAPLRVISVTADDFGGFRLALSEDHSLDVFPDTGVANEVWRRLSPGTDREHFVIPQSILDAHAKA